VGGGLLVVLGLVLFVACANVAQLRMAQAEARKREIGVRMALGANARRIVGQLLLETSLAAIPGAALGLLLAGALLAKAVEFLATGRMFLDAGIRLDARVLTFTMAATLFTVLIAGLLPARLAARLSISEVLKSGQGATGARTVWRQRFLIVVQAAVSVALLGTMLLFVQSLRTATAIRPGFDTTRKLLVLDAVPGLQIPYAAWCEQVCERLAALPGARAATFARRLPLSDSGGGAMVRVVMTGQAPRSVRFNNVAGNYFAVMGTRVVAGRGIDTNDRERTQPVTVVSQTFARQFLPARNPLGEYVPIQGKLWQVVGVAEDAPSNDLHEPPEPYLYFSYAQMPPDDITLLLETAGEPAALARAMNSEIRKFDSHATLYGMTTLRQHMDVALSGDRLMTTTASVLGLFSIGLMAAGLFGVLQYAVARRTRELGLRVALGATPRSIQRLVLSAALRIVAWGIPIGLGLLAALAWLARSAILGVSPLNPLLYITSALAVFAITVCAAWLPARRATRIEPMDALRSE
jgi:predicted permease